MGRCCKVPNAFKVHEHAAAATRTRHPSTQISMLDNEGLEVGGCICTPPVAVSYIFGNPDLDEIIWQRLATGG